MEEEFLGGGGTLADEFLNDFEEGWEDAGEEGKEESGGEAERARAEEGGMVSVRGGQRICGSRSGSRR